MAKRKGVAMLVDEGFFKTFEKEREKEQNKLRNKFGGTFNLGQRNFTAILHAKKFKFEIPRQKLLIKIRRRRRR